MCIRDRPQQVIFGVGNERRILLIVPPVVGGDLGGEGGVLMSGAGPVEVVHRQVAERGGGARIVCHRTAFWRKAGFWATGRARGPGGASIGKLENGDE